MEPQNTPKGSNKTAGIVIGVIVVLAVLVVTVFASKKTPPAAAPTADQTVTAPVSDTGTTDTGTTSQVPPADTSGTTASVYKDGTYSATGSYMSPGGPDQIGVTLTLKNDIITSVTATPMPGDPTSAKYQNKFMSGYQALVVGMNIADVHLTKVSGSSLTPGGFDDALAQIEAQAKA